MQPHLKGSHLNGSHYQIAAILNCGTFLLQERSLIGGEQGSSKLIYALVVAVDPTYLLFGHDGAPDEGGVVIAECEGFPAEELVLCGACLGTRSGLYGYEVLYTDTPFVGAVDTRLVGANLSYFEHGGVHVGTHVLRSFVTPQEMAYAMTSTVTEGDADFPHSMLSESNEINAAGDTTH